MRYLNLKGKVKVGIGPEVISDILFKHLTEEYELRSYAIGRAYLLGTIGEELAQRHILPKLCLDFDYVVRTTGKARPKQEVVIGRVTNGELKVIAQTSLRDLTYLDYSNVVSGDSVELSIKVHEDLSKYANSILSEVVINELIKTLNLYLIILDYMYFGIFDFLCLSLGSVNDKLKVRVRVYGSKRVKLSLSNEIQYLVPKYSIERARIVEVKSTMRRSDDVINEARWDMKRKIEKVHSMKPFSELIRDGALDAYLVFVELGPDLSSAVVSIYEFKIPE